MDCTLHNTFVKTSLTDIDMPPAPETNHFQTDKYFFKNGFQLQVYFPMCWHGKNIDSLDHKSHIAYPDKYNIGNCPSTHSVRLSSVSHEAF